MRHLRATRLLPRLVLATCSAAAFAALDVSPCQAQDEPTAVATDAPDAEPQPWQPQLAELSEQLASLRQELDELKSRPTPDAKLEIKRLDEKIDLLRSLLSKPDAPSKADLDSLREFLSLQDNLVERHAAGEIKRIDEKVDLFRETLIDRMNNYVWAFGIIGTVFVVLVTFFGRNTITAWIKQQIAHTTEEKISEFVETELKQQGEQEVNRLLEGFKKKLDEIGQFHDDMKKLMADIRATPLGTAPKPEVKAKVENVAREISKSKKSSEYTGKEWYLRGVDAYFDKEWETALECFSKLIELDPDHADAYIYRGNTMLKLERHDEALADFTKAIEIKPVEAVAYYNRGITLGKLERNDEALADFTKATELKPDEADAYINRGITLGKLDRHDEALADYTKAIELKPDFANAYHNRGATLDILERYDEALADFTKAIEIRPNNADTYLNAAENRILADQPDAALEYLDSATPYVQEAEDRASSAWLACIATALLEKDTTAVGATFAEAIKEDFKKTWTTEDIERWLDKAELKDDVRAYIREKIEQFKAH